MLCVRLCAKDISGEIIFVPAVTGVLDAVLFPIFHASTDGGEALGQIDVIAVHGVILYSVSV